MAEVNYDREPVDRPLDETEYMIQTDVNLATNTVVTTVTIG